MDIEPSSVLDGSDEAVLGGSDTETSNSVTTIPGGVAAIAGADMGFEVGQVLKPPRSNGSPIPSESCQGCLSADGTDIKEATGETDSDGAFLDVDKNRHTCGRTGADLAAAGRVSASYETNAASIAGGRGEVQKHTRGSGELGQEAAMGDLSTPVTSAGAGDVGAEHDATPLQSRPPRDASRGGNFTLASLLGGGSAGGGGTETASEAATSASGMEEGSSNGEGRDGTKRKDTITWESFLANISVSDGAKEEGGPRPAGQDAGGSSSNSSSPAQFRLPRDAASNEETGAFGLQGGAEDQSTSKEQLWTPAEKGHSRPGSGAEHSSTARTRYLRAMTSNAGAVPWNNRDHDEEERGDSGSSGDTESMGMPELSEGRALNNNIPRLLSDLSDRAFSPRSRHLDLVSGRSHSMSSVGLGSINNVRKVTERGINKFNTNPKEGIAYLIENGLVADTPESICDFLSHVEGLSKRRLGEYFGRDNPKAQQVLRLFLKKLEYKDTSLDEALRSMVVRFRLPGEAQQMDRIMESFAARYHEENPDVFSCKDTAWVLAFGLMILNTDMYNRNIREGDKMTESQFVRNHRGIDQGKDPPKEMLQGMYRRIKAAEIRMDEGDMYESEVITFVAPKKSGWLKKKSTGYVGKWKRHWFVLNDAVLYYFIAPQHQDEAPRCIIPLEGIHINPIGLTDLSIGLRTNQGHVKSVKMGDNGIMQQGQHRSFVLRAESVAERDTWVEALRAEVPAFQMELSSSRSLSATPATSSAPTPIGTPSESGRRTSKFGGSMRDRRRRATIDSEASGQMPTPAFRGWARTQSDQHHTGVRRYVALFRDVGPTKQDNIIYFFGDATACDKMIGQHLRMSLGCLDLSDMTRIQLQQEEGSGGGRAIALQTGTGKHMKEMVIVPEEQREFLSWTTQIKECCPGSAYSVSSTPITGSLGDSAFPSVNTIDSNGDGMPSPSSGAIAEHLGASNRHDDVFVAVGAPPILDRVTSTADSKGPVEGAGSDAYGRSESSETQPADAGGADGNCTGANDGTRVSTTPSSETHADGRAEPEAGIVDKAGDPEIPPGVTSTSRSDRELSTAGTDVE